jgi:predicted dehydrogenase
MTALDEVDLVVNLTTPDAHEALTRQALESGKHVYTEKPLALNLSDSRALMDLAKDNHLLLGCAPDTFLGASIQTARKLIGDGWIGKPIGAIATMMVAGPERVHPNPEFLYRKGAGPLLDSGPYFVTALTYLLGPAVSATCMSRTTYSERTITSQPRYGQKIKVEVPTYVSGTLAYRDGSIATLVVTVDVPNTRLPGPGQHNHVFEVYGTEGTLSLPSPCYFAGQIYCKKVGMTDWVELPNLYPHAEESYPLDPLGLRGLGVVDLASALLHSRKPRASADLAYHTLETMLSLERSAATGMVQPIHSDFELTAPMALASAAGGVEAE